MSPIIVPQWLGTWVYAQMLDFGFPTTDPNAKAKVAICYHQYGFPQNMDLVLSIARARNITLIEDCAHAAASYYNGSQLGWMGDFGIFSYSKFAFCYALGGITAHDPNMLSFVEKMSEPQSKSLLAGINFFKMADEFNLSRNRPVAKTWFNGLRSMAYSRYGVQHKPGKTALSLWLAKRDAELEARRANYKELRDIADRYHICDHLEQDGVVPYAVPLDIDEKRTPKLLTTLRSLGVSAGVYQFDYSRCVFQPTFRPCVLIPIHSGMAGEGINAIKLALGSCL